MKKRPWTDSQENILLKTRLQELRSAASNEAINELKSIQGDNYKFPSTGINIQPYLNNEEYNNLKARIQKSPTETVMDAIERDDLDKFKSILGEYFNIESSIRAPGLGRDNFCTQKLLHMAVNSNSKYIFNFLLEAGADVNALDEDSNTPLHYAANLNDVEMVRGLIEKNANPNAVSGFGYTPLYEAVWLASATDQLEDAIETTKALLQGGADASHINVHQNISVLNYIAAYNDWELQPPHIDRYLTEIVSLLLEYGANPNIKSSNLGGLDELDSFCLLEWAITAGLSHTALVLIHGGAEQHTVSNSSINNPCTCYVDEIVRAKRKTDGFHDFVYEMILFYRHLENAEIRPSLRNLSLFLALVNKKENAPKNPSCILSGLIPEYLTVLDYGMFAATAKRFEPKCTMTFIEPHQSSHNPT
jgi:ankyrin repeat protein